jgi:hypothetical protein
MLTLTLESLLGQYALPLGVVGAGAIAASVLERRDKKGWALVVILGVAIVFFFAFALPMLDRMMWMFSGILQLP